MTDHLGQSAMSPTQARLLTVCLRELSAAMGYCVCAQPLNVTAAVPCCGRCGGVRA